MNIKKEVIALRTLLNLTQTELAKELLGNNVHVYIDRPMNSIHPYNKDITYAVNYGYIKELISLDGEYQDAYVIGVNAPTDEFDGVVYAIVNRYNEIEDKLIVTPNDKTYTEQEIEEFINFQEKFFKHKIITK